MTTTDAGRPYPESELRRGLRERHLDLLLAEEFHTHPEFARWMADGALLPNLSTLVVPPGPPHSVTSSVSFWDPGDHPQAAGETDVLVRLEWDGSAIGLFVEDKLDAVFQPWQVERYRARATAAGIPTATILVAPQAYLDHRRGKPGEVNCTDLFGKQVSIEAIARWLREQKAGAEPRLAARLAWRAGALDVIATAKGPAADDARAVRFTALFTAALGELPGCVVDPLSCHTANQGWIWFREPEALGYKAIHGFVDLYIKYIAPDPGPGEVARLLAGQLPPGFVVDRDTADNAVLRARVPRPMNPISAFGPDGELVDKETFEAAVAACQTAVRWLASDAPSLLLAPTAG